MRIVSEINRPECKITIFQWNEKYLVKFEIGMYEQTYKIDEYEVADEEEVKAKITDEFIQKVMTTFDRMHHDWGELIN